MQSGTRIFAPFIFSRMNDMKSWFFFARLEAEARRLCVRSGLSVPFGHLRRLFGVHGAEFYQR